MTSRRITALSLAASLILIAVAGAVAIGVMRQPEAVSVATPRVVETTVVASPTVTMTLPPPVTVTVQTAPPPPSPVAAPPTAQAPSGPTIGDVCHDRMKFATDPVSGQEMICDNYSEMLSKGEPLKWFSAEKGTVGPSAGSPDGPRVGRVGSSCDGEVLGTMGRSSDGYAVWCNGGPGSYMPGTITPTWMVFHP